MGGRSAPGWCACASATCVLPLDSTHAGAVAGGHVTHANADAEGERERCEARSQMPISTTTPP